MNDKIANSNSVVCSRFILYFVCHSLFNSLHLLLELSCFITLITVIIYIKKKNRSKVTTLEILGIYHAIHYWLNGCICIIQG